MLIIILICMLLMKWSLCTQFEVINQKITLENVHRSIDLSSQIAKIVNRIIIKNDGMDDVNYILFCTKQEDYPAYLSARAVVPQFDLKISDVNVQGQNGKKFWKIELNNSIVPGKIAAIEVSEFWTEVITPYPKFISQNEKQLVKYEGMLYLYSPYRIKKTITIVALNTKNAENYTEIEPTVFTEDNIIYGAYYNIVPFNSTSFNVHYENNSPFLIIKNLERTITVSHWGNIAIEESFQIFHSGAKLKGPFKRYLKTESHIDNSITSYKTFLPSSAIDIYYLDNIGNIYSSNIKTMNDSVELVIKPRFPLFGGWKTRHTIGYNVPSYEYLYKSGDDYFLKMRILDHVYNDMIVQKLTTKIILPEGVYNVDISTPYPMERTDEFHQICLDPSGRLVLTLTKENLIENHIQDFYLQYQFPSVLLLQEPLLIVIALYSLFLLVIIFVRLDCSTSKTTKDTNKMRSAELCTKILLHQQKRTNVYQQYDKQLSKLRTTKDINSFNASMKSINKEYKIETNIISGLCKQMKQISADVYDKLQELKKLDKSLKDLYIQQQSLYYDKVVPGKIARAALAEAENVFFKKRNDLLDNINHLYKSFE